MIKIEVHLEELWNLLGPKWSHSCWGFHTSKLKLSVPINALFDQEPNTSSQSFPKHQPSPGLFFSFLPPSYLKQRWLYGASQSDISYFSLPCSFFFPFKYNWPITWCEFQLHNTVIQYFSTWQNDLHSSLFFILYHIKVSLLLFHFSVLGMEPLCFIRVKVCIT